MRLRRATPTDADPIGAVHVTSWREAYKGILPDGLLEGLDAHARSVMWRSVLTGSATSNLTNVFLAEGSGGVIGFGACGAQRDENLRERGFDAEIGAIYVLQDRQRAGVGRALMYRMAQSLIHSGRKAASLWVLRENARARAFYEELGGAILSEKVEEFSGATLVEVAYGWKDLAALASR